METLIAIMSRRSVRALKTDSVPEENLEMIVRAASVAANAGNRQIWTYTTI